MVAHASESVLGIAPEGSGVGYALLSADARGAPRLLAQGMCTQPAELAAACADVHPPALLGVDGVDGAWRLPGVPTIAIDPLEGHLLAPLAGAHAPPFPYLALVASARRTALVRVDGPGRYTTLGQSLDASAGEVFDALAQQLGMDLPGGPALARLADFGAPTACDLPSPALPGDTLDFSFAELRAAVLERAQELEGGPCELPRADLAASVQEAVVAQLARQTAEALRRTGLAHLATAGGVCANAVLRERLQALGHGSVGHAGPPFTRHRSARAAFAALLLKRQGALAARAAPRPAPGTPHRR